MTITHYMPTAPTGLTASLADGGTLDANTTYYLVVVAADANGSTRIDLTNSAPTMYSPYSAEISITTTTTQRTINLSWNQVMKPNYPSMQVDGYIVLVSKTPGIASLDDTAQIAYCPRGYSYLSTLTNSISISSNPTIRWHNVRYGLPLVRGLGDAPHTVEDLASYYKTNLPNHYQQIGLAPSNPVGHVFYGIIVFNNYSAGVTFTAERTNITIFGYFNAYGKVSLKNVFWQHFGTSHGYGIGFYSASLSTSTIENTAMCLTAGKYTCDYSATKTWCVGSVPAGFHNYAQSSLIQAHNGTNISPSASIAGKIFTLIPSRLKDTFTGRNINYDADVIECARNGGIVVVHPKTNFQWSASYYSFIIGHLNASNYAQFHLPHYLDCFWEWQSDSQYGTTSGFFPKVYFESYYAPSFRNYVMSFWRSIRVFVKDERGNPVSNARVSFWSLARGTNLTHGNSSAQMVGQRPDSQNTTYNWDSNDVNFQHNANHLWLYDWNNNYGTGGSRYITVGQTCWMQAEKVKIIAQLPDTPYRTGVTKFSVQRGVDNTVPQWQYLSTHNYTGCFTAPDYHTTDANGFAWNPTLVEVYKKNITNVSSGTYKVSQLVSNGWFEYYAYFPIKVRIEKSGYIPQEVVLSYNDILKPGVKQLELQITLKTRRNG